MNDLLVSFLRVIFLIVSKSQIDNVVTTFGNVFAGGNSAIEEAEFIAKFASKVTIIHQFDKLQGNKLAQQKAYANPKINFLLSHEPRKYSKQGNKLLVEVEDLKAKKLKTIECNGAFIFIGMKPRLDLFGNAFELDQYGYIQTNEDLQSNISDVYAVGDVISKKYR